MSEGADTKVLFRIEVTTREADEPTRAISARSIIRTGFFLIKIAI
jgi:hypothetical protein